MGAVIISKSPPVLVKPWEPVTEAGGVINLSSYDKPYVGRPSTIFLVFDQQIDAPAETIKRGLSKALLYYYPMSGRLAAGATAGEVVVECNGEGVSFVVASANCALDDVPELDDLSVQEELAIFYPAGRGAAPALHTDPLLLMQVTLFSCGGFIVGLTFDHSIADGRGIGQFLEAVGELSRGLLSPSVIPVRSDDDDSLACVPPTAVRIVKLMRSLLPSQLVRLHVRVPSSLVSRIKQDYFSSVAGARRCSVFDVVTAVLWQCRTRAVMEDPESPAVLSFAANARKYAGAKDGYYGNCFTGAIVMTTCGAVAKGDILDVIKMIQHAKDQVSGQYTSDDHGVQQELDAKSKDVHGYNVFCLTTWRNLGAEKADFGGGRPTRMMRYTKYYRGIPFCVSCLPAKTNNEFFGAVSLCVKEEHAGAFLQQVANFT